MKLKFDGEKDLWKFEEFDEKPLVRNQVFVFSTMRTHN